MKTSRIIGWGEKVTRSDIKCLLLAKAGISVKKISEACNISIGQVKYRLRIAEIKLADYRNGKSDTGQRVIDAIDISSNNYIRELKDEIVKVIESKK